MSMSEPAGVCEEFHIRFHGINPLQGRNEAPGKRTREYSKKLVCLHVFISCIYKLLLCVTEFFCSISNRETPPSGQTSPTAGLCPTYLCCIYTNINSFALIKEDM